MFFDILKERCAEKGIKLTPLLKKLGISLGSTSNWKNGTIPNGEILEKLAEALDCSVDYLLGRDDNNLHYKEQLYNVLKQRPEAHLFIDGNDITDLGFNFVLEAIAEYKANKRE